MLKRLFLGFALLRLGLAFPAVANAVPITASEVVQDAEPYASMCVNMNIEIETQHDGSISREFVLSGEANDIIVAYAVDAAGERFVFPRLLELYNSSGDLVPFGYHYPRFAVLKQPQEFRSTFLLPTTGEYRLVVEDRAVDYSSGKPLDMTYLLHVRTVGNYERSLILAEDALVGDQPDEALEHLAIAVKDSPELPTAYFSRVFTYIDLLFSTPAFDARLDELGLRGDDKMYREADKMFALVYETFLTLDGEEQAQLISDFRQLGLTASNPLVPDALKIDDTIEPSLFTEVAEFLTTGIPTDGIREYFFGRFRPAEEPIVEPKRPEAL